MYSYIKKYLPGIQYRFIASVLTLLGNLDTLLEIQQLDIKLQ